MKRKWDVSTDEVRAQCVAEVIAAVDERAGESFGMIAAGEVIDIVLQKLGPDIYNLALKDAQKVIQDKLSDLDVDLDLLRARS